MKTNVTALILMYYKEYQNVINVSLPNISIKYYNAVKEKRTDAAYITYPEDEKSNIILNVDKLAYTIHKGDFKNLMFHEFTHILDCVQNKIIINSGKSITIYSEIHAAYIQLQSAFDTIGLNTKKVSLTDKMIFENKTVFLDEFLKKSLIDIMKFFRKFYETGEFHFFTSSYKHALYYFGAIRFCEVFCSDDFLDYYNLDFFEEHFGSEMIDIFNAVQYPFNLSEEVASLIFSKETEIAKNIIEKQEFINRKLSEK